MSKRRPYLAFYPADWRADQAVATLTEATRLLWIECLFIMHEATPRGHLRRPNDRPLTIPEVATLTRLKEEAVREGIRELVKKGVAIRTGKRDCDIASRRMLRETEKAEISRKNGAKNGEKPGGKDEQGQGVAGSWVGGSHARALPQPQYRVNKHSQSLEAAPGRRGRRAAGGDRAAVDPSADWRRELADLAVARGEWDPEWGAEPGKPGSPLTPADLLEASRRKFAGVPLPEAKSPCRRAIAAPAVPRGRPRGGRGVREVPP